MYLGSYNEENVQLCVPPRGEAQGCLGSPTGMHV